MVQQPCSRKSFTRLQIFIVILLVEHIYLSLRIGLGLSDLMTTQNWIPSMTTWIFHDQRPSWIESKKILVCWNVLYMYNSTLSLKGNWHAFLIHMKLAFWKQNLPWKKTPAAYAAQVDQGEKRHPAGMVYITSTHWKK